jgi:hypothetical protein
MYSPPLVVVAEVTARSAERFSMTYAVPPAIVPALVVRVMEVSEPTALISYQVLICEGSVEPNPMRFPTSTPLRNVVDEPVTPVPDTDTVPAVLFAYLMRSARIVLASDVPGKVTVMNP